MELEIKDVGVIKSANIDLSKSLCLFCGQNGTGKTYLSYIIYALTKKLFYRDKIFGAPLGLIEKNKVALTLNIDKIIEMIAYSIDAAKRNFDSIFGISEEQVEFLFKNSDINLKFQREELEQRIYKMSVSEEFEVHTMIISLRKEADTFEVEIQVKKNDILNSAEVIEMFIISEVYRFFAFYPLNGCYILPVERNSIYTFSRELSISRNILVEQLQKGNDFDPFELIGSRTNRYPVAISDGILVANDLSNLQKRKSQFVSLAEEIENSLLNGKLSITDKGDIVFASNKSKTRKLPIHMTASIIKTLSSLVFYLKHLAQKGDLIVIDEPEMNMHPDNQILLTRLFAKLMRNGFRLLISTHSDYIIREFNNLIMLHSISEEQCDDIEKLGYRLEEKINPNDVACYSFRFKKANSRQIEVEKLNIDKSGVAIPTIDKTVEEQNMCAEELSYLIEY